MEERPPDSRFSLANERTFLAWIRTSLALIAGGVAAAKALQFNHEVARWVVSAPPVVAGALLAFDAARRWRRYETAMRIGNPLPVGYRLKPLAIGMAAYGLIALLAVVLDG